MRMLLFRMASWPVPEAATAAALLFVLAIVAEPLWQVILAALRHGGP
jgi:hypothetical protein